MRPGELAAAGAARLAGPAAPEYARRWPPLGAAAWSPPIGDGAASNIGSGCVDPSRAAVTVGTSAAVRLVQAAPAGAALPPLPHRLWRYRVDDDRVVTGAAYSDGGNLFAWATGVSCDCRRAPRWRRRWRRVRAGRGRHRRIPRFGGDRPPGLAPAGSGELRGLGFGTTAVEMLRRADGRAMRAGAPTISG